MNNRHGFTLTELLVVVAIIAVLAGMMFPAIRIVLVSARSTKSMQQMGQIGLALQCYASDNEMAYPMVAAGNPLTPWCRDPIDPYLPMKEGNENPVFSCPNARSDASAAKVRRAYSAGGALLGLSSATRATNTAKSRVISTIINGVRAVLLFDASVRSTGLCRDGTDWDKIETDLLSNGSGYIDYRHGGKARFMFADMHMETFTPSGIAGVLITSRVYEGL